MIRKLKNQRSEMVSNPCDGKGEIKIHHLLEKDDFKGKCYLFGKVTMYPGSAIGLHVHDDDEEIYYITKGRGRVIDDNITTEVGPGDTVVTGGGSKHALENMGDGELEFIAVIHYIK